MLSVTIEALLPEAPVYVKDVMDRLVITTFPFEDVIRGDEMLRVPDVDGDTERETSVSVPEDVETIREDDVTEMVNSFIVTLEVSLIWNVGAECVSVRCVV